MPSSAIESLSNQIDIAFNPNPTSTLNTTSHATSSSTLPNQSLSRNSRTRLPTGWLDARISEDWKDVNGKGESEIGGQRGRRLSSRRISTSSNKSGKSPSQNEESSLSEVVASIIYVAIDAEEPIIIISPSCLPVSSFHSSLFPLLAARLAELIQDRESYSIILLASETLHAPSTAILISTYLSLEKMVRKKLKHIWIVGLSWRYSLVVTLFSSTLLSAKSAKKRKIVQVSNLSELAKEMGEDRFRSVEFPPSTYTANLLSEKTIGVSGVRVFGVPLETLMPYDTILPPILESCIETIESSLTSIGIFRTSPGITSFQSLRATYDRGHPVRLSKYGDAVHLAASLIKSFLTSLPNPIFSAASFSLSEDLSEVLATLGTREKLILKELVKLLKKVIMEKNNLMGVEALIVCMGPCLIGGLQGVPVEMKVLERVGKILKELIEGSDELLEKRTEMISIPFLATSPPSTSSFMMSRSRSSTSSTLSSKLSRNILRRSISRSSSPSSISLVQASGTIVLEEGEEEKTTIGRESGRGKAMS